MSSAAHTQRPSRTARHGDSGGSNRYTCLLSIRPLLIGVKNTLEERGAMPALAGAASVCGRRKLRGGKESVP